MEEGIVEKMEERLKEREREEREIRRIVEEVVEEVKREILREIEERFNIKRIEAKLIELSKTVENIMSDVLYLKSEIKGHERKREIVEYREEKEEKKEEEEGELIIVD